MKADKVKCDTCGKVVHAAFNSYYKLSDGRNICCLCYDTQADDGIAPANAAIALSGKVIDYASMVTGNEGRSTKTI